MIRFTIITFNPDGDSVVAMYIDGILHTYGDWYHDKIEDWLCGFFDGLDYANQTYVKENLNIKNKKLIQEICDYGSTPPGSLFAIDEFIKNGR